MKTSDFDYHLPQELIAQTPVEPRDSSRLLVLNRENGTIEHRCFKDVTRFLKSGDVLVMNNSRVIPARLFGKKAGTEAAVEILLLRHSGASDCWEALVKPGKKLPVGTRIYMEAPHGERVTAEIKAILDEGVREVSFSNEALLPALGNIPLPPYIHVPLADPERYQTVYAEKEGSVAAPTAGLHFTPALLEKLRNRGVHCLFVMLHVGLNTFRPVQVEVITEHPIFPEYGVIGKEVAQEINRDLYRTESV